MIGITRDRYGFRAYVKVGREQRTKRFPANTSERTMQAWRDETKVALRKLQPIQSTAGTLEADAARYLLQVRAMPTYEQRAQHIALWIDALGTHTRRATVTASDIRTILHGWHAAGIAAATCNKRRSALMHLWTVLDGRGAGNPVRDVPKFRAPDSLPRGRDPHVIDAALRRAVRCRMRACARVLLWTGMRPVELQRAQPEDLDLKQRLVLVRTAKGGRVRVLPLTSQALAAWQEFDREDCWGRVPSAAPMNRWLKKQTGMPDLRVYDLRHTYGTALARRQTRLDVIGSLMGHSTLELTKRYTLAAVSPDALAATLRLARSATSAATRRKKGNNDKRRSA